MVCFLKHVAGQDNILPYFFLSQLDILVLLRRILIAIICNKEIQ